MKLAYLLLLIVLLQKSFGLDISGSYRNELGSNVTLHANADGSLTGSYSSAVGNASGSYPLLGSASASTVGFCVTWNNKAHGDSDSTTCWTGQIMVDLALGRVQLDTFWILASKPSSVDTNWASNRVGNDVFEKVDH